jgi:hypothetical protein
MNFSWAWSEVILIEKGCFEVVEKAGGNPHDFYALGLNEPYIGTEIRFFVPTPKIT